MSTRHLKNITISRYESFLELAKCKYLRTTSGHCSYSRQDLSRPITFQTHIEPVPEFIIKNGLRTLGYSKNQFFEILESEKIVIKIGGIFQLTNPT